MRLPALLLLLLLSLPSLAQKQLLDTPITLHCSREPLEKLLLRLHDEYGLEFSYSDDVIPLAALVSISLEQQPLHRLLEHFKQALGISYQLRHGRIILNKVAPPLLQTIRGRVLDAATGLPLAGAAIRLAGFSPPLGAISDGQGAFRIDAVPVGRLELLVSSLGYHSRTLPGLLLGSARELVLEVKLQEAVAQLEEVIVTGTKTGEQPQSEFPLVSARSFSIEESRRFAGSLGDPARMAAAFAGVSGASDENNSLIIRGNSPRGVLWRIEGMEVPNPNHFSTEGASSGVVSVLSTNVLEGADFLSGAFSAEYGNALSGVFDLRLRAGNNQKREHSFQLGMLGVEASTEGPFVAGHAASYLLNYRYSSLALLDRIGVDLNRAGEFKDYQDLSFKINYPAASLGTFSVYGIGGLSRSRHANARVTDKNYSDLGILGFNHQKQLGRLASFRSAFSVSGTHISRHDRLLNWSERMFQLDEEYKKTYLRASLAANRRFSGRHLAEAGLMYSRLYYSFYLRERDSDNPAYDDIINFREKGDAGSLIIQAYAQAKSNFSRALVATYGLHLLHFGLTGDYALEPRLGLRWQLGAGKLLSAGFGKHSRIENLQYYLARDHQTGGNEVQLNRDLGFTRALHYVLGYEQALGADTHLKLETYFQQLYHVPVHHNAAALYSAINEDSGFITDSLLNKGSGRNAGLELSVERSFKRNFYYLLNAALFTSSFSMADGQAWNTSYNGNYSLHAVAGYELPLGSKGRKSLLGINAKLSLAGGRRYIPIDLAASVRENRQVYDRERAYESRLPQYFRADLQLHYKRHRRRFSSEWRLDIQNATHHRNAAYYYYNAEQKAVSLKRQIGLLPLLTYRIEF